MARLCRRSGAVQPRVCGERERPPLAAHAHVGSAPRVRGEGGEALELEPGVRFSPACAGRGPHEPARRGRHRFSPACAGRGRGHSRRGSARSVQPRVCGERKTGFPAGIEATGSAPRVRGEGRWQEGDEAASRFSPACAGRGAPSAGTGPWSSVQPRVCGERALSDFNLSASDGSAPRVRGEAPHAEQGTRGRRFSPACAGRGTTTRSARTASPVQPRVCGERSGIELDLGQGLGSAPRVRGEGPGWRP